MNFLNLSTYILTGVCTGNVVVSGGDNEDAATEERISQILSEAQAAMQKKHSDEQVLLSIVYCRFCYLHLKRYQRQNRRSQSGEIVSGVGAIGMEVWSCPGKL